MKRRRRSKRSAPSMNRAWWAASWRLSVKISSLRRSGGNSRSSVRDTCVSAEEFPRLTGVMTSKRPYRLRHTGQFVPRPLNSRTGRSGGSHPQARSSGSEVSTRHCGQSQCVASGGSGPAVRLHCHWPRRPRHPPLRRANLRDRLPRFRAVRKRKSSSPSTCVPATAPPR